MDASPPRSAPDGRRFDFKACLGRGGFGEVYLAEMTSPGGLRTTVAVKLLLPGLDPRSQAVQRLRDEAKLLAALRHNSILQVYDLVMLEERVGLIAEYVEGGDLKACMYGDDRLVLRPLLEVIERAADGLDAAYNTPSADGQPMRLVHRDIKPANIRLSTRGAVKVLDFGIAKAGTDAREARTQTDMIMGTVAYMAPERFQADAPDVGPGGDVFALGCILYEGLAGEPIFEDRTVHQMMGLAYAREKHREWVLERVDALRHVPLPVAEMLCAMLDHDPAHRPSAAELVEWCEEMRAELTGPSLRRWCRDHTWAPPDGDQDGADLVGRSITEGTQPSWTMAGAGFDLGQGGGPTSSTSRADTWQPTPTRTEAPRAAGTSGSQRVWSGPPPAAGSDASGSASRLSKAIEAPPPPPVPASLHATGVVTPELGHTRGPSPSASSTAGSASASPASGQTSPASEGTSWVDASPPPPSPSEPQPSKRRGGWILGAVVAVALLLALGIGSLGILAALAAGAWSLSSDTSIVDGAGTEPGAEVVALSVADTDDAVVDTDAVASVGSGGTAPVGNVESSDSDGTTEVEPPADGAGVVAAVCPLGALEKSVTNGGLSSPEGQCAGRAMRDPGRKLTEREAYGRLLLKHARMRCQAGAGCEEFERTTQYFLAEITQSDPTISMIWAEYLFKRGVTSEDDAEEILKWCQRALDQRTAWKGREFVQYVQRSYEIQAKVAAKAHAVTGSPRWQNRARDFAAQWANFQLQLGRDASEAVELCIAVAGAEDACRKRLYDPSKQITVSLLSLPLGGVVAVDGKAVGMTPVNVQLSEGEHQVRVTVGDVSGVRDILVGMGHPTKYVFQAETDKWKETQ